MIDYLLLHTWQSARYVPGHKRRFWINPEKIIALYENELPYAETSDDLKKPIKDRPREKHTIIEVSISDNNHGYYVCETPQEIFRALHAMRATS